MKLLVSGASGFVGKSFLKSLMNAKELRKFSKVVLIGHNREVPREIVDGLGHAVEVKVLYEDLSEEWHIESSINTVVNLAADGSKFPYSQEAIARFQKINEKFLEWCGKSEVSRIVHVSSGVCDYLESDSKAPVLQSNNKSNFALGRKRVEEMILSFEGTKEVRTTVMRLYSFVGPEILQLSSYAITQFLQMALNNHVIAVRGNSKTRRSYLSEYDLGQTILNGVVEKTLPSIVSVGDLEPVSFGELAEFIAAITGSQLEFQGESSPIEDYFPLESARTLPVRSKIGQPWRETVKNILSKVENPAND